MKDLSQFRSLYFNLAPLYTHSAMLDSCGYEGVTGGFYFMGFTPEETLQLKNNQIWINGKPHKTVLSKKNLCETFNRILSFEKPSASSCLNDGWVGVLGYELNHWLEPVVPLRSSQNPMGELYFVKFKHKIIWYPKEKDFRVLSSDPGFKKQVNSFLEKKAFNYEEKANGVKPDSPSQSLSKEEFEEKVMVIKRHIQAGSLYQANLSIRFEHYDTSPAFIPFLYRELVNRNPSPFSGMFQTPEGVVVSNSPERLVKYNQSTNILETRPIAGTRGRGKTEDEEVEIAKLLQTDPKEQAEHIMLLDLERNDIGRAAQAGSVHVPELMALERYSHVTHIVSQVEGQKNLLKSPWDIIEAMFPGGTITGCPKIRCMQILHELEPVPRGFYTGSLGYIDSCGNMDFNILIRSLFYWPNNRLHYHAGAGIVFDSVPAWEYRECLRKAEVIKGVLCHDYDTSYS